jgi:twitching motility protein PilT
MARIYELFRYLKDHHGSDLHLSVGLPPRIRIHGELADIPEWEVLTGDALRDLLREIASDEQWRDYEDCGDLDFAHALEGVARFRVNYLRQQHGAAAVFRIIPEKILTVEELGLPKAIERLAHLHQGLVLVTGPTGSGKSTTLAAIIDRINTTYAKHVITIEEPVEFVHQNKRSVLSQREVGTDTPSFATALKVAVRQDADVILVGEMRDLETISLAITAAEMGALVFGTLHTNNAAKTVDRLIDAFPAKEQPQVRTTLSESISAIVSQLLLRSADGMSRFPAFEILLRTSGLPNIIREGNTPMLQSVIQGGGKQGMCTMDDSLYELADKRKITAASAYQKASDKQRFEHLVAEDRDREGGAPAAAPPIG